MKYKIKYYEIEIKEQAAEVMNKPEAIFDLLKDENDIQEKMIVIGMNTKNKVLIKKTVAVGGYNSLMSTPADIFIPLLKLNARNFVLAHNHPSGDVEPSKEDFIFTKKIEKAAEIMGLQMLDHIVFNDVKYYSMKRNGII